MNSLSYAQFRDEIQQIHERFQTIDNTWKLHGSDDNIYLTKIQTINTPEDNDEITDATNATDEFDEACDYQPKKSLTRWEYHVVYHPSYQVPVMCFNVYTEHGSLIDLERLWKLLKLSEANRFETLTQMCHPVLQTPFFTLHPCRTNDILQTFATRNLTLSWLSVVAHVVGLHVPVEVFDIT